MHCRSGRIAAVFLAATLLGAGAAQADYNAGRAAWDAGRHGEAVRQWEAAAKANDVRALLALGRAFAKGVGVPRDFIEAHKWLNLAAGRGSAEAAAERDALEARMTMEEQAEARKLARAWRMAAAAPKPKLQPKPMPPARKAEQSKTPAPAAPPPKRALREAQTLLARLGYRPGPADGDWRPESRRAYRRFLGRAGMKPRDTLTPAGLRALRRAAKDRAAAARSAVEDLHRAVQAGDIDGLKAALSSGAAADARDRRGWTALMHAANKGHTLMVAPLLAAKADPNVRAADGATALFMAAAHGHGEIIELLMKGGADVALKGPKGRTAVDIARLRYGNAAAARRKGADIALLALLSGKKWAEVAASPAATETVLGLNSKERRLIQTGLAAAGFNPGPADGAFGPATRAAVRAWQKKNGKAETGYLTAAVSAALVRRAEAKFEKIRQGRLAENKKFEKLASYIQRSLVNCGEFHYSHLGHLVTEKKVSYEVSATGSTIRYVENFKHYHYKSQAIHSIWIEDGNINLKDVDEFRIVPKKLGKDGLQSYPLTLVLTTKKGKIWKTNEKQTWYSITRNTSSVERNSRRVNYIDFHLCNEAFIHEFPIEMKRLLYIQK